MRADALSIVEAAYAVDVDDEPWLSGIAEAARAALDARLGMFTVAYDASVPSGFRILTSLVSGMAEALQPVLWEHTALFDPPWVEAVFLRMTCDHIRHRRFAQFAAAKPELLDRLYRRHGIEDIFCINALDPTGLGHQINVLRSRRCELTATERTKWSRVAAHIAAGNRLRQRLRRERDARPEAVLAPDGKVVHAEGDATAKEARERLRESARRRERVRAKSGRKDPHRAIAEWKGLIAARWSLVDQFETDGRRYLVAQKNDPDVGGLESLTPRERCAVGFAVLGHSNKHIAYEMGIAPSTVAVLLSRAARRLGTRSRDELVRKFLEGTKKG